MATKIVEQIQDKEWIDLLCKNIAREFCKETKRQGRKESNLMFYERLRDTIKMSMLSASAWRGDLIKNRVKQSALDKAEILAELGKHHIPILFEEAEIIKLIEKEP